MFRGQFESEAVIELLLAESDVVAVGPLADLAGLRIGPVAIVVQVVFDRPVTSLSGVLGFHETLGVGKELVGAGGPEDQVQDRRDNQQEEGNTARLESAAVVRSRQGSNGRYDSIEPLVRHESERAERWTDVSG